MHGTVLVLIIGVAFLLSIVLVQTNAWIHFNHDVHWVLYLAGVIAAMMWIRHSLRGAAERLGALTWWESVRLTGHQLVRLMVVLFTLAFITKDVAVSRAFLEGFLLLSGVILVLANRFLPALLSRVFFDQRRLRTIIVAPADQARLLQAWLKPRRHLGVQTLGYVTDDATAAEDRLGTLADLGRLLAEHAVDQVVIAQNTRLEHGAELERVVENAGCRMQCFVNMDTIFGGRPALMEHSEHYTFTREVLEPLDNPANRVLKRTLDILVAAPVVLLVLPPLTLAVWVMQRLQSPGPVFYSQMRSGLNRRRFRIFKYRTMASGGEASTGQQASANDSRVFAFGRFLRRTSLDEIPQFLNVILGSMSVSGPRPHLLEHDERFAKIDNSYYKRHFVKPGITGLSQCKGFRGEMREDSDLSNRVHYDEIYVANWSLWLDLSIIFRTIRQVIRPPRTAY
ncbi:MAG: exopolysaccharide biosynthesis polyprenyl glycosylphosphotransferase [Opitutaceae bacterium]